VSLLKSPQEYIKEFMTSDAFFLPGKTQMAYEKDGVFDGFRKDIFNNEMKYVRFNTYSHYTNIVIDIDDDILVEDLYDLIDNGVIPEPIYIIGEIREGLDGPLFHRPHLFFALNKRSSVRRESKLNKRKDKITKKWIYTSIEPSLKALAFYDAVHASLCNIFAMNGYNVDFHKTNCTKNPFASSWSSMYFGNQTYSLTDLWKYNTPEVQEFAKKKAMIAAIKRKEERKQSLLHKIAPISVSPDVYFQQTFGAAVNRELSQGQLRKAERILTKEDIISSYDKENGSRNVEFFNLLRTEAYAEKSLHEDFGSFISSVREIGYQILTDNEHLSGLMSDEIGCTIKSVAKWTWYRYKGNGKNKKRNEGAAAHLIPIGVSISQAQAIGAYYSNDKQRANTRAKVAKAVEELKFKGEKLTSVAIAKEAGITRQTAVKYYKDGKIVITNNKMFNELLAGTALISPATYRNYFDIAERSGFLEKASIAADMLIETVLKTVLSEKKENSDATVQAEKDRVMLALIFDEWNLSNSEIAQMSFEDLENYVLNPKSIYEKVGVRIDYEQPVDDNDRKNRLLASLDRLEEEDMSCPF
jgi:hypothetical protein